MKINERKESTRISYQTFFVNVKCSANNFSLNINAYLNNNIAFYLTPSFFKLLTVLGTIKTAYLHLASYIHVFSLSIGAYS